MNDLLFYVAFAFAVITAFGLYRITNTENLLNFLLYKKEYGRFIPVKKPVRVVFPGRTDVYTINEIMIVGKDKQTGEYTYAIKTAESNEIFRYRESQLKNKTPLFDAAMDRDVVVQIVPENVETKIMDKIALKEIELKAERERTRNYAGYLKKVIEDRNLIEKEIRKGRREFQLPYSPYSQRLIGGYAPPVVEEGEEGGEGGESE